ncbi:MAG TPA: hypothetical protein VL443_23930 [Cyclobacteriaceae bacterium]|jgi:hypothetical protein|nr:hypothetical protein [Cyclobacteriaceae bacterium]
MSKQKEVLIIHFRSAMDYPPVYNIARYMAGVDVSVTIVNGRRRESSIELEKFGVRVVETGMNKGSGWRNYLAYFVYYIKAFYEMVKSPRIPVIYFESISSPPVYLFFLLFPFSKRTLAIHYHEYFDKEEHKEQSFLERFGRRLEPLLFKRAMWISHTNNDRLYRFHSEFPSIADSKLQLLPNYPSERWIRRPRTRNSDSNEPIRLVYVGSVSMKRLFLPELAQWLIKQQGKYTCDIYSKNMDNEVLQFLEGQPSGLLTYKGSVHYDHLPELLPLYDVGLILYNGLYSNNFVYNAPNKLFEYYACGLDVWFSDTLISSHAYETHDTYPKILKIDFSRLDNFDAQAALNRVGLEYRQSDYVLENVYNRLYKELLNQS